MARTTRRSRCPIATSLDIFGDRWSLLIVRDLMFKGRASFGEFIAAGEDIATNILADRLVRLEDAGIIRRGSHPVDGRKTVYGLTPKGLDLAPVMVELTLWAARHERIDTAAAELNAMKKRRAKYLSDTRKTARRA